MGSGTLGLLATLVLRLRGLDVTTFGRTPRPYLNADLLDAIGARYVNTAERSHRRRRPRVRPVRSRSSKAPARRLSCSRACWPLAKNGVLVLSSITGGGRTLQVPADRINLEFVLGNKVMVGSVNASRDNFETGVRDMAQAEARVSRLAAAAAHPPRGRASRTTASCSPRLQNPNGAIKIFCEVAPCDLPGIRRVHRRRSSTASCPLPNASRSSDIWPGV